MVPSGWKEKSLENITKEKISYGIVQAGPHVDNGVPYLKSSDVGGEIDISSLQRTAHDIHEKYKRSAVHPNDIVFSLRGNIGRTSIVPTNLPEANLTQGTARISVNNENNTKFVYYSLATSWVLNHINSLSKGSTFKEISLAELRKVKLILPPLPEQQKIAKILTTWAKAINTTKRLLENSKQQKKALMQQLLTGQKRLLDDSGQLFSGDWEEKPLQEVFPVIDSLHKTPRFSDVGYPMIRVADIKGGNLSFDNALKVDESVFNEYTKKYKPKKGDIVFSRVGSYGNSSLVNSDRLFCLGQNTVIASSNQSADSNFIYQFLNTNYIKRQIEKVVDGSSHKTVSLKVIRNLKIKIPLIQEQQKIAAVLTNADREIEVLEQQLADLQQEKKALMQQLLTGKKRVLVA